MRGVRITVDTDHDPNAWEEIDAVQLHGFADTTGGPQGVGGIPPEPEPPVLNPDDIRDIIIKLKLLQEVERIEKKIKMVADSELRALIELAQRVEEDPANLQRLVIAGRWLRELMAREGMLGDPLDEIFPEQRLKREAMELLQRAREQVSE